MDWSRVKPGPSLYGYRVVVASDATAAMTDAEHNAALLNLEIYYAHVLSSEAIVAALD